MKSSKKTELTAYNLQVLWNYYDNQLSSSDTPSIALVEGLLDLINLLDSTYDRNLITDKEIQGIISVAKMKEYINESNWDVGYKATESLDNHGTDLDEKSYVYAIMNADGTISFTPLTNEILKSIMQKIKNAFPRLANIENTSKVIIEPETKLQITKTSTRRR